jgi:plasmid stabilization system protein ParE
MKRFVLTPSAERDVNDILGLHAVDSTEAADRVLDALESAMVKIAKNAGVGHWREELADWQCLEFCVSGSSPSPASRWQASPS